MVPEIAKPLPGLREDNGLLSWVASVDHKQIGIMYILASLMFFLVGGLEALLLRVQLATPENTFLSPDAYNQIFTMHGTTMIFLVVMPVLLGFATYLVPLMIGARDMAFPRLNALSFWLLVFGGLLLYFSFIGGGPRRRRGGAVGGALRRLVQLCAAERNTLFHESRARLLGAGPAGGGHRDCGRRINLIVTIVNLRAPGMSLRRLPLFVWMVLVNSFIILFALPPLNAGTGDAAGRPQARRPLLPGGYGRLAHPLAALLLGLWPSRSLHHDPARLGNDLGNHSGLLAQTIFGYEFVAGSTVAIGVSQLRRLCPPHVRGRAWGIPSMSPLAPPAW